MLEAGRRGDSSWGPRFEGCKLMGVFYIQMSIAFMVYFRHYGDIRDAAVGWGRGHCRWLLGTLRPVCAECGPGCVHRVTRDSVLRWRLKDIRPH